MIGKYINVHIFDVPYQADCEYTYFVPSYLSSDVKRGSIIVVPFGKSDKHHLALAIKECNQPLSSDYKTIISVLSDYFTLNEEMIELCYFMKRQTLSTIGEAVKCMVPASLGTRAKELFTVREGTLAKKHESLFEFIKNNPNVPYEKLKDREDFSNEAIAYLLRNGYVKKDTCLIEQDKTKYENRITLKISKDEACKIADGEGKIKLRSQKQCEILTLLCEYTELSDSQIYSILNANKSHIDALLKKDLISLEKIKLFRDPYKQAKENINKESVVLNEVQESAFSELKSLYYSEGASAALLYGITGSGKTSVIKKMIDEVIKDNKSVIILVPEISLTPQTVSVFCGYYGDRVAVIHSSLSLGERFDTYKKIKNGEIDIVIGTRSAVFAPLENLGMIVIDEEQEHTYKSDTSPKYLAHDIARFRVAKNNALMLLASATPSLNSFYKAKEGKYALIKMMSRYGVATLPDVIITDMRKERVRGNASPFSVKLLEYMQRTLEDKKQSILFLNRRGYHSSLSCQACGQVLECPNCSVALTYHSYKKIDKDLSPENIDSVMAKSGILRCHYCGYHTKVPSKCKECGQEKFDYVGFGTQRAEGDLKELFPSIRALRLDADTTTSKSSYERILSSFRQGEADVMIGTQMVTKGHNFPSVTLVGVVLADTMLYTSDYRASERTFSMLTQVIGRAGRAKDKGSAIIQTNSPNDQAIILSARQDYDAFYENEIQVRKAYNFPPFCDIAMLTISSTNEKELDQYGKELIKDLEIEINKIGAPALAYGPFEAPVYKAQGRYRKRIIIKCKLNNQLRDMFSSLYIKYLKKGSKNHISIDFNPSSI
ncbi:MAG: primosomal protein N' [Clostridia bacterium]|nr:primosomal protein N' [Clostridia bacterium]